MSSQDCEATGLLAELQRLLEASDVVADLPYVYDPDYLEHFQQFTQIFAYDEYSKKINFLTEKMKIILSGKDQSHAFRVCSIGCGDGCLDEDILSTLARWYPDHQMQYVGIDTSKAMCEMAQENLKPGKNVNVKIINQDFMDFTDEPFDVIVASHSFYYFTLPELAVKKALTLTNKNGLVLVVLEPHNAFSKPRPIMCRSKDERGLFFSNTLAGTMNNLGIKYTEESYTYTMDLTTCFKDNFQLPKQKNFLDFCCHQKLKLYPDSVTKILIAYLNSISTGKPENKLINAPVLCFSISH